MRTEVKVAIVVALVGIVGIIVVLNRTPGERGDPPLDNPAVVGGAGPARPAADQSRSTTPVRPSGRETAPRVTQAPNTGLQRPTPAQPPTGTTPTVPGPTVATPGGLSQPGAETGPGTAPGAADAARPGGLIPGTGVTLPPRVDPQDGDLPDRPTTLRPGPDPIVNVAPTQPGGGGAADRPPAEVLTPTAPRGTVTGPPTAVTPGTTPGTTPGAAAGATPGTPPRGAAPEPGAPPRVPGTRYTVEEGDRLAWIARDHYGDEKYFPAIVAANPGLNPDRILVGQVLTLPPKDDVLRGTTAAQPLPPRPTTPGATTPGTTGGTPPTGAARTGETRPGTTPGPAVATRTYVVKRGDSLRKIAETELGDRDRWRDIYELNRQQLRDPDRVLVGARLTLPPRSATPETPRRP